MKINFPSNIKMCPASERSGHHLRYDPVLASRNTYKYSFFIRTIPTWNRLPLEAVTAPTTNSRQWLCQQFGLCSPLLLTRSSKPVELFLLAPICLLRNAHLHICEHQFYSPWTSFALFSC